jgi:hypothetical protein
MRNQTAAARRTKADTKTHDIGLRFGKVVVESGRLQVPVSISREECTLEDADTFLCGRRLDGTLVICDDNPHQPRLPGMELPETELTGVFDCKGFSVSPTHILAHIAFEVGVINLSLLRLFPGHLGLLRIQHSEQIPAPAAKEEQSRANV